MALVRSILFSLVRAAIESFASLLKSRVAVLASLPEKLRRAIATLISRTPSCMSRRAYGRRCTGWARRHVSASGLLRTSC